MSESERSSRRHGPHEQDDVLEGFKVAVQEELRGYGQYLAMRGATPGEQRLGIPEISFAVMSIITWATGSYLKAYLEERGKIRAGLRNRSKVLKEARKKLGKLEQKLHESNADPAEAEVIIRHALDELREHGKPLRLPIKINEDALVDELRRHGLTERAARSLAPQLAQVLASGLSRAIADGHVLGKKGDEGN